MKKIIAQNKSHLKKIISHEMNINGNECDLNHIDISRVDNFSGLFGDERKKFNGNISHWDVSHVINMKNMFFNSKFNGDISKWNTENVKNMSFMFQMSEFNGDISQWKVSKVETMEGMFNQTIFNRDLSYWDISNVENISQMFCSSYFNMNISNWNLLKVKNMNGLFYKSKFNQDLSEWNISHVELMENAFLDSLLEKSNKLPYWYLPTQEERINAILKYRIEKEQKDILNSINLSDNQSHCTLNKKTISKL